MVSPTSAGRACRLRTAVGPARVCPAGPAVQGVGAVYMVLMAACVTAIAHSGEGVAVSDERLQGSSLEEFRAVAPAHGYRAHLGDHFSPDGALPPSLCTPLSQAYLEAFLSFTPCDPWYSTDFRMPSHSWRSELPSTDPKCADRWAVGLLVFERLRTASMREVDGGVSGGLGARVGKVLGVLQLEPSRVLGAQGAEGPPIPFIVEAHLALPTYATRGHWHIVQGIAGTQYGLTPFCGISLFFQRGTRIDCGFVAVQSALMVAEHEIDGRPLGVLDIMGNAVRAFLDCPWVREHGLDRDKHRSLGRAFQAWMERDISRSAGAEEAGRRCVGPEGTSAQTSVGEPWRYWEFVRRCRAIISSGAEAGPVSLRTGCGCFPTLFELLALALREDGNHAANGPQPKPAPTGIRGIPPPADFNCGAVVEWIDCRCGQETTARERLKQLLADYISSGYPVIAAAHVKELPEYNALRKRLQDAWGARQSPEPATLGTDDHALLILGHHITRPSEVRPRERTYGRSVDAFIVSDLSFTPFLKVNADNLCDALLGEVGPELAPSGIGEASVTETDAPVKRAELLVVLPKGVSLSAGHARLLTTRFVEMRDGLAAGTLDVPEHYAIRTALFTPTRAIRRFNRTVGEGDRAGWEEYCERLYAATCPGQESYVWSVEIHQVAERPDSTPTDGEWRPHPPLYTLHWLATRELRPPGSQELIAPMRDPLLFANHLEGWHELWPATPSRDDAKPEGPTRPQGRCHWGDDPEHV